MIRQLNILFLAIILLGGVSSPLLGADDTTDTSLHNNNVFCSKCHTKEITAIESAGGAHNTDISCTDCHSGHKPRSFENIPHCNQCHTDAPHYNQRQCLNCHRDPHQPLQIKLPKKAHTECLACHERQGEELLQPSYHGQLVCTDCHDKHGFLPDCMSCHNSHSADMTEEHCKSCHAPHKPLELAYSKEVPTLLCSPCHNEATDQIRDTKRKHGELNCAECHFDRHGTIPQCQNCHGKPHASAIHTKFPQCSECHGTAHNLN